MQQKSSNKQPTVSEHERKNEGGREFGHVHQPTQAEQASRNSGLADDAGRGNQQQQNLQQPMRRQPEQPRSHQKKSA